MGFEEVVMTRLRVDENGRAASMRERDSDASLIQIGSYLFMLIQIPEMDGRSV